MMRIAGRNDQGRAKAIQTDRDGNQIVVSKITTNIVSITEDISESVYIDTKDGSTAIITLKNPNDDIGAYYFGGRAKLNGDFVKVPCIDSNGQLREDRIDKEGIYYVNVSGFEQLGVKINSSSVTATISVVITTAPTPQPIDSPVKYKRINSEDGLVKGKFRAIEPLTDITLHEQTQLAEIFSGSTNGGRPFERGDERKQGHTLFGHFNQVRLESGTALLVLL